MVLDDKDIGRLWAFYYQLDTEAAKDAVALIRRVVFEAMQSIDLRREFFLLPEMSNDDKLVRLLKQYGIPPEEFMK